VCVVVLLKQRTLKLKRKCSNPKLPSVSLFSWQFATLPTGKERTGN
jgi:hypothetical protein